ncbi:GPI transamidase component GPI16 [Fomitiporia mediterranea MF3/22]|uniref:GPI transamidase component GPI16 n=1 Tax=Fomitiporia mediterranea (strain MF3/22) TaxID=694068 RepID=UPI000440841D|nr:GPI transamidase component GPI16 [Fomitiporia mediterranea MF3/22]EJC98354.1 GPI transamidase component GPI16 [Fomitiporia mediterranea MF3/22]
MPPTSLLFLLLFTSLSFLCSNAAKESFNETLTVRPLRDGRVAARFLFTITQATSVPREPTTLLDEDTPQHYSLLPLSLGQVLREYAVTEAHLSLNAGKWDYGRWGDPEDEAVASGAELWAWMGDSDQMSVEDRWKGLRNAFSGLFCASMGSLDDLRTTSPSYAFRPDGDLPKLSSNQTHKLRYASLPSENVCTENLTPFLKLLPCKSSAGIASLLNPHRLFDADWHGMSIHVSWSKQEGVKLQMSVQSVFDPVRLSSQQKRDFSFQSLFHRSISEACPVATESKVEMTLPEDAGYLITPEPLIVRENIAFYNIAKVHALPLDVSIRYPTENAFSYPALGTSVAPLSDILLTRTLSGTSQTRGRLAVSIWNNRPHDLRLLYVETMPWLVTFYLHTLDLTVDGQKREDLMSLLSYTPPEAHGRPTLLEAQLTVPAESKVELSMDVTKSFLRYTEHPPDAQRGWDLPPAIFIVGRNDSSKQSRRIYSPAVLVDVATPDFSMPYNVIIMSSTLIALIFGSIFNLLTRRFVAIVVEDNGNAGSNRQVN